MDELALLWDEELAMMDPDALPRRLITDFSVYNAEVRRRVGARAGALGARGGGWRAGAERGACWPRTRRVEQTQARSPRPLLPVSLPPPLRARLVLTPPPPPPTPRSPRVPRAS
jgi:hypothetical protein